MRRNLAIIPVHSCEIPVQMRPRLTGESAILSTQSVCCMVKVETTEAR